MAAVYFQPWSADRSDQLSRTTDSLETRTGGEKAITAVKADKAKAFEMFLKGEGGFKDRDLYPFCANVADGIINVAPASVMGKPLKDLKDKAGI
jgi:hypothetical protein